MTVPTEAQRQGWMAQWRLAAVALERVRLQEIRVANLARIAADLDDVCLALVRAHGPELTSGLIEQQRVLHGGHGG